MKNSLVMFLTTVENIEIFAFETVSTTKDNSQIIDGLNQIFIHAPDNFISNAKFQYRQKSFVTDCTNHRNNY